MKLRFSLLFAILCSTMQFATAQAVDFSTESSMIIKLGKTLPLSDLVLMPVVDPVKKELYKKNRQAPENFLGRGVSKVNRPELEHLGADPIRQTVMGAKQATEPIVNVDGLFSSFGSPHDPSGDVGLNYYIQAINATRLGVYNKDGSLETEFTGNTLWAPFGGNGAGDPIILFDEMANRWMITEFAFPRNMYIAMSDTDDPLGTYTVYDFVTPSFPDYPKFSIWSNAVIVTTNEGGAGTLSNYFINREELLSGADEVTMQRISIVGNTNTEAGFYVSTPLDFNGDMLPGEDALPTVMRINDSSWGDVPEDVLELFTFDIDWTDDTNTIVNNTRLVTTPFDGYPCSQETGGFACCPQPSGNGLDAIPEVVMNLPQYRNFGTHESMVLSFITDATDGENISAIRWMELRRTDSDWEIYQEGTYAPDDLDRYMCSIAMDKNGNIALAYNVSSNEEFVGIRYTGRFANDPLGTMTVEEVIVVEGQNNIVSGGRFGDYAQIGLDPVDGSTFWYTSEYAGNPPNSSKTRIVAFQLEKSNFDASPINIISPVTSSNLTAEELVTVEVLNRGLNTIESLEIGYIVDDVFVESFLIPESLEEGETYMHTFATTVDMSAFGDYTLRTYTHFTQDELTSNDTITSTIRHIPSVDGSLTGTSFSGCQESTVATILLENKGLQPITEADIEIYSNDALIGSTTYTGTLQEGDVGEVKVQLENLVAGTNVFEARLITINGMGDQVSENDIALIEVELSDDLLAYTLILNLDNFPDETSWELLSTGGETLGSGDSYLDGETEIIETFCLVEGECFIFIITDTAGDGICCEWGLGSYEIQDAMGNIVVSSDGEFVFSESNSFCANENCFLETDINIVGTNNADGSILINVSGGVEPFSYSIDGGETFQNDPFFDGLEAGEYDIVVSSDGGNCTYKEMVVVPTVSSITEIADGYSIVVSPNPGPGRFKIALSGYESTSYTMQMQVIDATGKTIQEIPLQKYNNVFRGEISLVAYPSGVYYLRYMDEGIKHMSKVIKL